ncbi:hypothetical protein GYMLUDRAFT_500346 [Collybiopsis luxurians FD-317 M1]|uniref:Cytochrome P450 n=1 Tax=Collybiopsis luxurians FD-317 M1 TaxID=944289 RepID=A0A0D0D0F4_9AGAR|nr:hypothetical protein GYMLUDRAFT_500346 [Collybiopsis luxurians FD-317 M1]
MATFFLHALFGLASLFLIQRMVPRNRPPLPPGPPGLPFVGVISLLWERRPWRRFTEWKEIYGPVVQLNILGKTIIVLNTHEVAFELLGCRSKIYNGRPRSILIDEMMTGGLAFPLVGHGELWKRHRRAAQTVLNPRVLEQYHGKQECQSQQLVEALLREPEAWPRLVKDSLYTLFCSIGYGSKTTRTVSRYLEDFMTRIVQAAIPGSSLTDFVPGLASLPAWLSPLKRHRLAQFRKDDEQFRTLSSEIDTSEHDSMGQTLLENHHANKMTVGESAWLTAVLCAIGGEVTSSVLPVFFLAMALYPEVQNRAQMEIDRVIGRDRYPTFQDRDRLPYVQAIVREVLRWRPIGPIGFPRSCLQDDYYNGFLIPKGSIVLPNIWAMNRDPQLYPDYDEFRPERYQDLDLDVLGAHGQGHVSYGFGDRICSGMHIANDVLFINIAAILHACTIKKSEGQHLDRTTSTQIFDELGVVTRPGDFACKLSRRSTD